MSERAEFLPSEWKVFIDGVEIPHQGFVVTFTENVSSTISITVEPDKLLTSFRPQSLIHVFARDQFPSLKRTGASIAIDEALSEEQLSNQFRLFWEGYLTGHQYVKAPQSRAYELTGVCLFSVFETTKAYSIGVGPLAYSAVVSGSDLPPLFAAGGGLEAPETAQDIFSIPFLAKAFSNNEESGEDDAFRDAVDPNFSDRILRLITYLSAHNAIFRQQILRFRLLDKICGVNDTTLKNLIPFVLLANLLGNAQSQISAQDSVFGIIRHLMSYGFYKYVHMPFPHVPANQPKEGSSYPFFSSVASQENIDIFKFPKGVYRNEHVILPETYYAMPPPCNFVFPDMINSLSIGRDFQSEPTRYCVYDPHLLAARIPAILYLAPSGLIRDVGDKAAVFGANPVTSASDVFGISTSMLRREDLTDIVTPYQNKKGTVFTNLLSALSDDEYEKGVLFNIDTQSMEVLAAAAAQVGESNADTDTVIESTEANRESDDAPKAYRRFVTNVCEYLYQLNKFNRSATLNMAGHRWLAPGWPCVIFDSDIPHMGHVNAVSFSVSLSGYETTATSLSRVRPVPDIDIKTVREVFDSVTSAQNDEDESLVGVVDAYEAKITSVSEMLAKALKLSSASIVVDSSLDKSVAIIESLGGLPISQSLKDSFNKTLFEAIGDILVFVTAAKVIAAKLNSASTEFSKAFLALEEHAEEARLLQNYFGYNTSGIGNDVTTEVPAVSRNLYHVSHLEKELADISLWASSGRRFVVYDNPQFGTITNDTDWVGLRTGLTTDDLGKIKAGDVTPEKTVVEAIAELVGFLEVSSSWLIQYYEFQQEQESFDNVDDLGSLAIQTALASLRDSQLTNEKKASELLYKLETTIDWPVPPSFFNRTLLTATGLDETYSNLLGCPKFYTGPYASEFAGLNIEEIDPTAEAGLSDKEKLSSYFMVLRGLSTINNVYKILSDDSKILPFEDVPPSWDTMSSQKGVGPGVIEWENETFLRRDALTLGDFLDHNALKLERNVGDRPGQKVFWVMRPQVTTIVTNRDGIDIHWDNTIFSKLVDDGALKLVFGPEAEFGEDPAIRQARQTSRSLFLSTLTRQELVRAYSVKHFGRKGYDGT